MDPVTIIRALSLVLSSKEVATIILALATELAKKTDNPFDDMAVELFRKVLTPTIDPQP